VLGIDHPDLGLNYGSLGVVYFKKGEYELAIEYTEKAQALFIKAYGDDYLYLSDSYEDLAEIYLAQGNYDNARTNYNKAYGIALVKLGSDHPDTIKFAAQLTKIEKLMADVN
jgi:tetratricopeptide (TPR) repeat protein